MKTRLLAFALLIAAAPAFAQGVSITAFDRPSVPSLGLLSITGSGFNPATGAISVVFTARDAITATVPAASASATAVRVTVPALINSVTGNLFDTSIVADVQVVQVTSTSVMTSNTLGGLTIGATPQAAGAPGTFTKAFLKTISDVQSDLRTARRSTAGFGAVVSTSQTFSDGLRPLQDAVDLILKNPEVTVNLPTTDGLPLSVSAKTLRAMDRVGTSFVQQSNGIYKTSPGTVSQTPCTCNPISELDRSLCEFQKNACGGYPASSKVSADGATSAYGAQYSALASWAAGGLGSFSFVASETATGFEFLFSASLSYTTAILAGTDPPGASTLLRDSGSMLLQDLSDSGLGVFNGLKASTDLAGLIENAVQQTKGQNPAAPQGGIVLPAPQPASLPAKTRPQNVYSGRQSHYWTATPTDQTVTTLTSATLPAPSLSRFNGTYSGTSNATCTAVVDDLPPITSGASGPMQVTVADGAVTGGGSVSNSGRFTAPAFGGAGLTCTTGGMFWLDGASGAGGSGFISCGGIPGLSCSGTWNVRR